MSDLVTLESPRLALAVFPEGGGAIVRFARRSSSGAWVDLMRPAGPKAFATKNPVQMSCFALVPYCDFVTGGGFTFAGIRHDLPKNHPDIADPIHGEGWISPWQVEERTEDLLRLAFAHRRDEAGFPFSYAATLTFLLGKDLLEATVAVVNTDERPMPAGIGIHPYFVRTADFRIRVPAARVWPAEAVRKDQRAAIPVPPEWDFRVMRPLGDIDLDHTFADWDGRFDLVWPSLGTALTVTADPIFRNLQIYVPRGGDHLCVEPISNAMDAFNLAALGAEGHNVSVVQPGHALAGTVRFRPADLPDALTQ